MRRLLLVAMIGLAVAGSTTDVSAQGRGGRGPGRGGVADTARMRRMDSVRVARGDTIRRRAPEAQPGLGGGRGNVGLAGINLNDSEKSAVKAISEKYREEMKQLREANQQSAAGRNAQLREQMQAILQRERAEIRGALTAEHQAQFDANIAKRQARGAGGPPGRRPPPPKAQRDR